MIEKLATGLLWLSAVGCGLMGGLYFAFSAFIMTAFGRLEQVQGIAAMNAINAAIVRTLFGPLFFGTTLTTLLLAILGIVLWGRPGAAAMLFGGLAYVVGMFVVTVVFNVPLNNLLAAASPAAPETAALWTRYLADWTFWNHVRTVASTAACILFITALTARG